MLLRYFFETILTAVTDSCYDLKSQPYAPVFHVKTIKIEVEVRISTFSNISSKILFWGYSSGANQNYGMIQNWHCKQS